jgi:hypothetical protein
MVKKTWTIKPDDDGFFLIVWDGGKARHNSQEGAQKSVGRKVAATVRAWERYGWRVCGSETGLIEGNEYHTVTGEPPDSTKIAVTYRLPIVAKQKIEEEAKRLACDEIDVLGMALDLYFNGATHDPD